MSLRVALYLLFLVLHAAVAKPYGNYGFYSPYPPPPDQVLYDFSPLEDRLPGGGNGASKSRETRDLAWRENFDQYLDGTKEPSCEELLQMWRLSREIQRRAIQTNEVPKEMHPFLSYSYPVEETRKVEAAAEETHHRQPKAAPNAKDEDVTYGVVKTHQSHKPNKVQVRDPAREIYGLLRDRAIGSSSAEKQASYGSKQHHEQSERPPQRYFDILQEELLKDKGVQAPERDTPSENSYGSVRHFSSDNEENESSSSNMDRVRELMSSSRRDDDDDDDEVDPFDRIREELMNTRSGHSSAHARFHKTRAFRRKSSKKRRRNVSSKTIFLP